VKRSALAVGLLLSVSWLASAQHQGTSSSSSSSSGGSASGSSGGSSGGYGGGGGGGSSHSTGSSGGSSGYGGGSSSGGYSGGSHSSSIGSSSPSHAGGYFGGPSSGSHSSAYSPPSPNSSGNAHNGGRENTSHSNIRVIVTQDARRPNSATAGTLRGAGTSNITFQSVPTKTLPGSAPPDSIQDEAWMPQPFHIALPPENLDKQTRQQMFAARVREVGLEPSKSSYKNTIASVDGQNRHASWVGKLFGEKTNKTKPNVASQLRPCLGKECKPTRPPKPCVGPKCQKPVPTPVAGVCTIGYRGPNGACQPWGYFERCSYPYGVNSLSRCRVQWASVDSSYCRQILEELYQQRLLLQKTKFAQAMACSTAPQDLECASLTLQLKGILGRTQQLEQQYQMCSAAAGVYASGPTRIWPPGSLPSNSWPQVVWP
jgi:hypothetical protein